MSIQYQPKRCPDACLGFNSNVTDLSYNSKLPKILIFKAQITLIMAIHLLSKTKTELKSALSNWQDVEYVQVDRWTDKWTNPGIGIIHSVRRIKKRKKHQQWAWVFVCTPHVWHNGRCLVWQTKETSMSPVGINGLMDMSHMSHLSLSAGDIMYLHFHVTVPGMLYWGDVDAIPMSHELQCWWDFITFPFHECSVHYHAVSYVMLYFTGSILSLSFIPVSSSMRALSDEACA